MRPEYKESATWPYLHSKDSQAIPTLLSLSAERRLTVHFMLSSDVSF